MVSSGRYINLCEMKSTRETCITIFLIGGVSSEPMLTWFTCTGIEPQVTFLPRINHK